MPGNPDSGAVKLVQAQDRPGLLLVDDDPLIAESLALALDREYTVLTAPDRARTRQLLQGLPQVPPLALVDLGLPPRPHAPDEGFILIGELLAFNPEMKILVLSGQSGRGNIQHALTLGAVDFIPKPCDVQLLKVRLKHQLMLLKAEQVAALSRPPEHAALIGDHPSMHMLRALIKQFADSPFPVLIEGESGSGKELVARQLHVDSRRAGEPLLTLNCTAFTPELLEAQLFGHARGAFTGATAARMGFFEEAGHGSLLLDEIGEMPASLQTKLLRVLENGEYYRLGETQARRSHARIIAATNRDLREEVRAGRFRHDLFHRLSVLTINVPPLRTRGDDCLLLLDHFRALYAATALPFRLAPEAEAYLRNYAFPGNVRELRNIVIRLLTKYPGREVGVDALRAELEVGVVPSGVDPAERDRAIERDLQGRAFNLDDCLRDLEKRYIDAALRLADGNLSQAARLLGINRTTLYSRLQKLKRED